MALAKNGVTAVTPTSILFGAGVVYKNLKFNSSAFTGVLLGATSGGTKVTLKNEIDAPSVDGMTVKIKGMDFFKSQEATAEVNLIELNMETMKLGLLGKVATTSDITGFDLLQMKSSIEEGDYLDNIAIIGWRTDGKPIIVILENAICTSGIELDTKDKDSTVTALTFEARADASASIDTLPVKIYIPNESYTAASVTGTGA